MMKKRFTPKTKQTKPLKPTACTVNYVKTEESQTIRAPYSKKIHVQLFKSQK